MGEKLQSIIKVLEQRMDTGVLHDLNVTRLNMLIGNEFVKQAGQLPDDDACIELIEKAMQTYFSMDFNQTDSAMILPNESQIQQMPKPEPEPDQEQEPKTETEPEILKSMETTPKVSEPVPEKPEKSKNLVNFKLNIKRNENNFQTLINQVPVLFSPLPVRKILSAAVVDALSKSADNESNPESLYIYIEETAFVKTIQLLTDVFHNLQSTVSTEIPVEQKIRLGLVIFRLLGYGDFKIESAHPLWTIILNYPDSSLKDTDHFSLGFMRGIFAAADDELFNKLKFSISKNADSTVITGSWI